MKQFFFITIYITILSCSSLTNKLDDKIETVELHYITWACDCANWATIDDINKYNDADKLASHCIFIEPANKSLILSDTLGFNGDRIQFTGQYYKNVGYPKDFFTIEEHVDKAKILRYTSFKIIKSNHRKYINDKNRRMLERKETAE